MKSRPILNMSNASDLIIHMVAGESHVILNQNKNAMTQVHEILKGCQSIADGTEFAFDIGDLSPVPAHILPQEEVNTITCTDAVNRVLRWFPLLGLGLLWTYGEKGKPVVSVTTGRELPQVNLDHMDIVERMRENRNGKCS